MQFGRSAKLLACAEITANSRINPSNFRLTNLRAACIPLLYNPR